VMSFNNSGDAGGGGGGRDGAVVPGSSLQASTATVKSKSFEWLCRMMIASVRLGSSGITRKPRGTGRTIKNSSQPSARTAATTTSSQGGVSFRAQRRRRGGQESRSSRKSAVPSTPPLRSGQAGMIAIPRLRRFAAPLGMTTNSASRGTPRLPRLPRQAPPPAASGRPEARRWTC
jgi:hypothetical protein